MQIEKTNSYGFEFDEDEIKIIDDAAKLLSQIKKELNLHNCMNIQCISYGIGNSVDLIDINKALNVFLSLKDAVNIY